jgi:hypothetical protein
MTGGSTYDVPSPAMAFLTRTSLVVGTDVIDGVPAEFKVCALLQVAAVEPLGPRSAE